MSKKPETLLKQRVLADLRALPNTYAVKIQQVAIRGIPDILACINGLFVALELKRSDTEELALLQVHELHKIKAAGGCGYVVTPSVWPALLEDLTLAAKGDKRARKILAPVPQPSDGEPIRRY